VDSGLFDKEELTGGEELTRFPNNLIDPVEPEESADRQNAVLGNGYLPAGLGDPSGLLPEISQRAAIDDRRHVKPQPLGSALF
jgi:hypothetical protein